MDGPLKTHKNLQFRYEKSQKSVNCLKNPIFHTIGSISA